MNNSRGDSLPHLRRNDSRNLPSPGLVTGLLVAAIVASVTPAHSGELVPADPWKIVEIAREFGPADVGSDGMRDPRIRGTINGLPYHLDFYGCRLGRDCDTILFTSRLMAKDLERNRLRNGIFSQWNRTKLFGRAWLDDDERAVLDHPVTLADGLPRAALRAAFVRWRSALAEFADHVGLR